MTASRHKTGEPGARMLQALQINFALWGMILCSAFKAAQLIHYAAF